MIKISIILPIYNVEPYLRKCISSVLNQTLQDIEVILATDGPDSCDAICKEFEAKDTRVKILWHPGSYGKACNQAMAMATGEYIGFVETDDWCHPQMFEKLYSAAKSSGADVCKGGFYDAYDNPTLNKCRLFHKKDESFHLSDYPKLLSFQPSIWSAIYKASFLKKNGITMIEERMPFIDAPFHMETLLKAKVITNVAVPLYYYYHDNPNQSVQNAKASFAGLKAEEYFYAKNPLNSLSDILLRTHCFRATLAHLLWDYGRLDEQLDKKTFQKHSQKFLSGFSLDLIDSLQIERKYWDFYFRMLEQEIPHGFQCIKFPCCSSLMERIFYLKNNGDYKVMNFLGLKWKFKRKAQKRENS